VRVGLCLAVRFLEEVTAMSSKKVEPASQPVYSTTLRYHLKPPPIEADLKANRKDRRSRSRSRRGFRVGGGAVKDTGAKTEVQAKPEPIVGWITRAEARSVLGIEEKELAELLTRFRLRKSSVEVYSKAEILALREIVAKLR
jgi:hypothetical protein